jgi:hypothetical protein
VRNHECNIDQNKPQENKLTKQQKDNQNSEQYFFIIGKYAKLPILFIKAYIIKYEENTKKTIRCEKR